MMILTTKVSCFGLFTFTEDYSQGESPSVPAVDIMYQARNATRISKNQPFLREQILTAKSSPQILKHGRNPLSEESEKSAPVPKKAKQSQSPRDVILIPKKEGSTVGKIMVCIRSSCYPKNIWESNKYHIFQFETFTDAIYAEVRLLCARFMPSEICALEEVDFSSPDVQRIAIPAAPLLSFKIPSDWSFREAENIRQSMKQ
jgi:hypothetical protein